MLDTSAVVTDPWFWAVAVPAVLVTGLSKSGFASGLGSLATPMIALTLPVPQAAAIMLPLLMAMDAIGLQKLWRERDPVLVRALVPSGLVGIAIGTLCFGLLSTKAVSGIVGALTLAFLVQQLLRMWAQRAPADSASGAMPSRWLGLIDLRNLATSALLLPLAPLGVWAGVRMTRYVSATWFYRVAYLCMGLSGTKLLWDGLS